MSNILENGFMGQNKAEMQIKIFSWNPPIRFLHELMNISFKHSYNYIKLEIGIFLGYGLV